MNNKAYASIGKALKLAREVRGVTQIELARALGYESAQFISLIERNQSKVPLNKLGRACQFLEIGAGQFVDRLTDEYREKILREMESGLKK